VAGSNTSTVTLTPSGTQITASASVTVTIAANATSVSGSANLMVSAQGINASRSGTIDVPAYSPPPPSYSSPGVGSASASPSVFQTATISWSGFSHGTNNAIGSYQIQMRESINNSTWGSASTIGTVTSSATSGNYQWSGGTSGYYYQFGVRAMGSVSGYNSGWSGWSSSIQKETPPIPLNAPGNPRYELNRSDRQYTPERQAVFVWGATVDPGGNTVSYEVQPLIRDEDNTGWIPDGDVFTVTEQTCSLDISDKPRGESLLPVVSAQSLCYRVRAVNALGGSSDWVIPDRPYARNPTAMSEPLGYKWAAGVVRVCRRGLWVPGTVFVCRDEDWYPALSDF